MSDLLFDDDPDDDGGPPINVLAVGVPAETSEALSIRAAMCRDPEYRDASRVIFEEEEGAFDNAAEFKRAMRWPRLPTMDEAGAWLLSKRAAVDERTAARVVAAGDG
jgi:hypothetical protein